MYSFVIKFYEKGNRCIYEYRDKSVENTLIINDGFIYNIFDKNKNSHVSLDKIEFWDMHLVSENLNLVVNEYTLFEKVSIFKASDGDAKINLLKANANLHLVNLNIDIIQVIDCNLLIANCKVNKVDFEIENFMKTLRNTAFKRKNQNYGIDIRNSLIEALSVYYSLSSLNIQGSKIKSIEFMSSLEQIISIGFFNIWQGCQIDLLRINCEIDKFKLEDSNILRLYFTQNSLIHEYSVIKSFYDKVFGCETNHFKELGLEEYELIKQSSFRENERLYFDVSYKLAELKGKEGNRFVNWFLKNSIGYGYKPLKSLGFIVFAIVGFAGLYSFIDLCEYLLDGYKISMTVENLKYTLCQFIDRIYFSGITFTITGYGDITPNNIAVKFLTVIESCLGVVMFSLLIYSLTVRHLSNK